MDSELNKPVDYGPANEDVLILRSITSRLYTLAVALGCAAVFGGIPIFGFCHSAKAALKGSILGWVWGALILPFVLLGIGLVAYSVRSFLQLFNPAIKLTLTPKALALGSEVELSWDIYGAPDTIDKIRIFLEATFSKQVGRKTKEKVLRTVQIAQVDEPLGMSSGRAAFTIPADAKATQRSERTRGRKMWTEGRDRRIIWTLNVKGQMKGNRPDIDDSFKVQIFRP